MKHTKRLVDRGAAKYGFVVTDGYRGDYACWAEALANGIPIATLYDLEAIAADPVSAAGVVKGRVGITAPGTEPQQNQGLPDREGQLMGWTLRFVDAQVSTK